ncbi:MAG: Lrp/AsnC ligand binding domain-containing protein [Candidatus Nitrosotenuis sp.]|nr:Lrp/AsnC ligand binding domain-containing protein [Candidatus Nitrosotenuis uzonensis]MCA2003413.1 Lrp/AsnC ligand binding domain-containing protein [Candidatus Nitrosotenuis sp.]CAE6496708.1 Transcriptional regulator, AsnC family [Candidatus Nitrosotenuis uzonensis]
MQKAYLLLSCEMGTEESVISALKSIDGIKAAIVTYGAYDIVAEIQTNTQREMDDVISFKIRQLKHVRSSVTLHATD